MRMDFLRDEYIIDVLVHYCNMADLGDFGLKTMSGQDMGQTGRAFVGKYKDQKRVILMLNPFIRAYQRNQDEYYVAEAMKQYRLEKADQVLLLFVGNNKTLKMHGNNVIGIDREGNINTRYANKLFDDVARELKLMIQTRVDNDSIKAYKVWDVKNVSHADLFTFAAIIITTLAYFYTCDNTVLQKEMMLSVSCIEQGELYRYVTYMLVHDGFWHVLGNMMSLYYIGRALGRRIGSLDSMIVYILGGVLAGYASMSMSKYTGVTATVGASGAIFALLGAMVAYVIQCEDVERGDKKELIKYAVVVFLFSSIGSNVDVVGHLAGLVSGFLVEYILYGLSDYYDFKERLKKKEKMAQNERVYTTLRVVGKGQGLSHVPIMYRGKKTNP